jgi:NADPH:quinone reductase-like Zn-dependent oxidoreductase
MRKSPPMKVFEIRDAFGLDHLQMGERPQPEPGPGEVLLRMRAVSLNYRDLLMAQGRYNPKQPLPLVPCSDGVGDIEALGAGVEALRIGQRVAPIFAQTWYGGTASQGKVSATLGGPIDGTLREYAVFPAASVVPVPAYLSPVEAATLPCAALTAWSALVTQGEVHAGDTVLVQGTGGVSIFALQIAQILGARVIVTSSSDSKLELARKLGSWAEINYRTTPDWGKKARQVSGGGGVDHIVEVGGAGTLRQSLRAIRIGGHISLIGVLAGTTSEIDVIPILMGNVRIQGILVGSRDGFEQMTRAFEQHQLKPTVQRVFPFEEAREAFVYLASAQHVGKICIEI